MANKHLEVNQILNSDLNLSGTTLSPGTLDAATPYPSSTSSPFPSHSLSIDDGVTGVESTSHTLPPTHVTQDTIIRSAQDTDLMTNSRQPYSSLSPPHHDLQHIYNNTTGDRSSKVTLSTLTNAEPLSGSNLGHGDGIKPESDNYFDLEYVRKDQRHCDVHLECQGLSLSLDQISTPPPSSSLPMDRGWRAWSVVVGSVLIQTFAFAPTEFIFGVFEQEYLLKFPGASPPSIALIGTIGTSTTYLVGFLSATLSDRWGYRITSCVGTGLMTLALILASFSKQVKYKRYNTSGVSMD